MDVAIIIPARYQSVRFPGKPLAELRGASGKAKTLIERSWQAAAAINHVQRIIVATDDERIAAHVAGFGGEAVMTSSACRNGTERCAELSARLDPRADLIINLQGDAPLTPPHFITELIAGIGTADVATPVLKCDPASLERLINDRRQGRVGGTTAVIDSQSRALYFSKEVLPFCDTANGKERPCVYHHVGVYAYTPAALETYAALPPGTLETAEGLEQLRFLENGTGIRCVKVSPPAHPFWELNNPTDITVIEEALKQAGLD